ncbi:GMC family oxidoreductase [Rhizobium sullae]|uniref:GMC family oxidoreductase n=2 Tax=Rhizobium sullae TaxID=50338 RepID=A0A2N0D7B0_RHISU|nr:GMC family oxidoreductase [Rhizobium sullae]
MISGRIDDMPGDIDVLIVGSGPVGLTLAKELRQADKRVLVVESGGLDQSAASNELAGALILEPATHDDVRICVSRQFGGTSNLWTGRCLPFDPIDFENRFPDGRWPISYDEIRPFYDRAVEYANCGQGFVDKAPLASVDARFELTHLERYSRDPKLFRASLQQFSEDRGLTILLNTTVVDLVLTENSSVSHVVARHKNGLAYRISCKLVVVASGGLEAARLLLNIQRRHPLMFGGPHGALGRYYMGHLFGHIAALRFSNRPAEALFDFHRDEAGAYVRRRIVPSDTLINQHHLPNVAFWPDVPTLSDPQHESAFLSAAYLALSFRPLGRFLTPEVIRRHHASRLDAIAGHLKNLAANPTEIVRQLPGYLRNRYGRSARKPGFFINNSRRTYRLAFHAEHFPDRQSHVRLSDSVDAFFVPRLTIDMRVPDENIRSLVRTHRVLNDWLEKNDLGQLDLNRSDDTLASAIATRIRHGTHQIGLTRMGTNRNDAVVDANLKIFDLANAYIASSSVFPTSSQANPTLTAIALAIRLAQHIIQPAP